MKLGNNEKIVLAILKKYSNVDEKQLGGLFSIISKKTGRMDTIIHSLKIKGFLTDSENFCVDKQMIKNLDLPKIFINPEQVKDLKHIEGVKLGKLGKSIIYVLDKIEKASLQFLSTFFHTSSKNVYAIMQRLEEKNIVISYNSRIRRLNSSGKKYHPKYYILTDIGKLWLEINENKIENKKSIDILLRKPEERIQEHNLKL